MDSRAMWMRLKAHGWAYTLSVLVTLSVGILIGTVISYGVKGKEGQKSTDVTPLALPASSKGGKAKSPARSCRSNGFRR